MAEDRRHAGMALGHRARNRHLLVEAVKVPGHPAALERLECLIKTWVVDVAGERHVPGSADEARRLEMTVEHRADVLAEELHPANDDVRDAGLVMLLGKPPGFGDRIAWGAGGLDMHGCAHVEMARGVEVAAGVPQRDL